MRKWLFRGLFLLVLVNSVLWQAATVIADYQQQLRVFIKDEGFHESNIVKPRIYVKNLGRHTISGFDLHYYFTVERGKTPVVEPYYLPNGRIFLRKQGGREYLVQLRFRNIRIRPGEIFPDRNGCIFGIHYSDWSQFIKTNDYSNPASPHWRPTRRITVANTKRFPDRHKN
ncbi:MAG TPA: hypothetical protein VIM29_13685 [Bacillota bacterium]